MSQCERSLKAGSTLYQCNEEAGHEGLHSVVIAEEDRLAGIILQPELDELPTEGYVWTWDRA